MKKHKFLDVDVKSAEDGSGSFWFTASTDARDRQGDVIVQTGWKTSDFMKNPVILWAHNYYETPIGKATEIKMGPDSMAVKIKFASDIDEFAAKVEKLVAQGYLKTVSVGFMVYKSEPLTTEDLQQRPDMKFGQRLYGDLLEVSIVPVPANPEALNENSYGELVARGFGMKQDEAISKFLPYRDQKGNIDARLLRASLAMAYGARSDGNFLPTDVDRKSALNHLYRIAKENGVEVPTPKDFEEGKNSGDYHRWMRDKFKDVWHDELLDVLALQMEDEESVLKLLKGQKRKEIEAARDALNLVLSMSEPDSVSNESPTKSQEQSIAEIISEIGKVSKNLAGK